MLIEILTWEEAEKKYEFPFRSNGELCVIYLEPVPHSRPHKGMYSWNRFSNSMPIEEEIYNSPLFQALREEE